MPDAGRGLVLVGLPGSGKSRVGRLLAERLGRPFRDTDAVIEQRSGVPAATLLAENGEEAFRAVEREALAIACAEGDAVVATGGGAIGDPLSRWRLWEHGRVVWLRAAPTTLLGRLAADATLRPLLAGDPSARLADLATERTPFYRAADAEVDAEPAPTRVAEAVIGAAQRPAAPGRRLFDALEPRHHPLGPAEARIVYGHGLMRTLGQVLHEIGGRPSLVVDAALARPLPGFRVRRLEIAAGERAKTMRSLQRVVGWLAAQGAERGDPLVGVGGGTTGDLAALAAALYARGVPYVAVPTTWLAQADAALGGKAAIDLPQGKNLAGTFWPAWAVLADLHALRSLPPARLRDGLAEAVRSAIVGDPALWRLLVERGRAALADDEPARYAITERAARVKLAIVRRDPFESGERRQLNLGHTIGHALEAAGGYRLAHGSAVALGLRAAARLASLRGGDPDLAPALDELLAGLGFRLRHRFDPTAVRRVMQADKKRAGGRQRWLLPLRIGQVVEADDVTDAELASALAAIAGD